VAHAEALLRQAYSQVPDAPGVNDTLAILAMFKGDAAAAVEHAQRAVLHAPHDAAYHYTLGRAFKASGDLEQAVTAYQRAIELKPRYAEAHVSLGMVQKAQGDLEAAIASYRRAIQIAPSLAVAHTNLGAALAMQQERQNAEDGGSDVPSPESIAAQQRAAALDPHDSDVQRNLGAILLRAGRPEEAMHAFNAALTLDPTDLEACMHFGKCLSDLGDHGLARGLFEKFLAGNADDAKMLRALAFSLTMLGEADEALTRVRRSLELEANPITAMQLGNTLLQVRRIEEAMAQCRQGIEDSGRDLALYPVLLMGLNYLHETPEPIFAAHREVHDKLLVAGLEAQPLPRRPRTAREPLRVGFVSGDFVRHSVPFFLEAWWGHVDPARVEIHAYHSNVRSDDTTRRLKALATHWVESGHLSDEALERRIRADGIDVLIDLTGMTASSRILMFARQPAPVQVGYLGYPTVTGVPAMGWRMTDRAIDPGDLPDFPSDKPLALPRSMFCYAPPPAPDVGPLPALRQGYVTFGSFNNIAKLTDHTLALWAGALNAVPGSHLLLKAAAMAQASNRADIAAFMARHGIEAQRLRFEARRGADADHLALYNEVDIALDSYPYNGATTTCEALWMGVPVITRRGATHTSRMGASILGAIGRSDWVAGSDEDFVRIAAMLSRDLPALAAWREGARARIRAGELCDGPGMALAVQAALEAAWLSQPEADRFAATTAVAA
jgi:predicted O-linked N-acetylglucosamine transferase (SPINDLY family)